MIRCYLDVPGSIELRPSLNTPKNNLTPCHSNESEFNSNFCEQPICINISEPFWVLDNNNWITADEYCSKSVSSILHQTDKRKFWEMMKLLHDLPILNRRCHNRLKTPTQVATVFKRKEFNSLWSTEAADCLNEETLKMIVGNTFMK